MELGVLKSFLEFLGLIYPELLFLGGSLLKLGISALRLLKLGISALRLLNLSHQPGHLVPFLLELGLMCVFALLLFGCAEIAELTYKIDTSAK